MSSERLTVTIPRSLADQLDELGQGIIVDLLERGLREYKIERALNRYVRGGMSFGAAAAQAGVPESELACHAYARGMEPPFSAETLAAIRGFGLQP